MFLRKLARSIRQQDWFTVVVEIFVVMIGLLTAFQVDRWWEARIDRNTEASYISRLTVEIEEDISVLEHAISLAEVRMGFCDLLLQVISDPSAAREQPGHFLVAVAQAAFTYTPILAGQTFEDLSATGNIKLIRDGDLKRALQEYYRFDQNQEQFVALNFMIEFRYFELSANILSPEQFQFVQESWFVVTAKTLPEVLEVSPDVDEVLAAAKRLSEDKELVDWLPKVRGLQYEQVYMNRMRLEKARSMLSDLKEYRAGLNN